MQPPHTLPPVSRPCGHGMLRVPGYMSKQHQAQGAPGVAGQRFLHLCPLGHPREGLAVFCAGFVNLRPQQGPAPRFTDDSPVGPGQSWGSSASQPNMQGLGIGVWPGRSRLAVRRGRGCEPPSGASVWLVLTSVSHVTHRFSSFLIEIGEDQQYSKGTKADGGWCLLQGIVRG